MLNVEIISVGTELLLGEILNTNAVELMRMCKELGFNVYRQVTVGDNSERLKQVLKDAFDRGTDLVITTGGLGPTNDDLTKQICCEFLECPLYFSEEEANKIKMKLEFLMQGKPIAKSNFQQAYFPREAIILDNEVGTANGCLIKKGNRMIANLPGPPREMKYVMQNSLRPLLVPYCTVQLYTMEFVVLTTGESQLQDELESLLNSQNKVTLALYAQEGYVRLRLATQAHHQQEANIHFKPMIEQLKNILNDRLKPLSAIQDNAIMKIPNFELFIDSQIDFLGEWLNNPNISSKIVPNCINSLHLSLRPAIPGEFFCMEARFENHIYREELPCLKQARYNKMRVIQRLNQFLTRIVKEETTYES